MASFSFTEGTTTKARAASSTISAKNTYRIGWVVPNTLTFQRVELFPSPTTCPLKSLKKTKVQDLIFWRIQFTIPRRVRFFFFLSFQLCHSNFLSCSSVVSKGQVHEGVIRITDKGSVVTWDFDVMRHDVVFTVYRLKQSLKAKSPSSTLTPTPTGMSSFSYPKKNSSDSSTTESRSKRTDSNAATIALESKHKKSEASEGKKEISSNRYTCHLVTSLYLVLFHL